MLFTRLAAAFALVGPALAYVAATSPSPSPRALDVESEVINILEGLRNVTDTVLPEIIAIAPGFPDEMFYPLLDNLEDALTTTADNLKILASTPTQVSAGSPEKGGSVVIDVLGACLDSLVKIVDSVFQPLSQGWEIPAASMLLTTISPVLYTMLEELDALLPGVVSNAAETLGRDVLQDLGLGDVFGK
ncbi:hypothetical protein CYLTODRAFT_426235 [Cylindrobasidium torrendii FP15055 ss-10]|uniref:Uncharacterized protein n=1 Tax=Cylindrobasidium torrendii FP15055 ss-10 TaxID=1314674 RepID=A0A0D7B193_9AGAR|nr:hypothetical protein CYLTODRAFT_426235 [Cylindrobasidium torrendii FP15055 ss-10]